MNNSPRHNVGSVADPHWVVDEEHYEKLQAELAAAIAQINTAVDAAHRSQGYIDILERECAAVTKRKDECSNGWDEALAAIDAALAQGRQGGE